MLTEQRIPNAATCCRFGRVLLGGIKQIRRQSEALLIRYQGGIEVAGVVLLLSLLEQRHECLPGRAGHCSNVRQAFLSASPPRKHRTTPNAQKFACYTALCGKAETAHSSCV